MKDLSLILTSERESLPISPALQKGHETNRKCCERSTTSTGIKNKQKQKTISAENQLMQIRKQSKTANITSSFDDTIVLLKECISQVCVKGCQNTE